MVVNPIDNEIFVEYAKRWLREEYLKIEGDIAKMHKRAKWDILAVEQNNTGEHVIEVLKHKYDLPVHPVLTYGKLSDPKQHHKQKTMSKPEMVMWYLKAKQNHMVKFPANTQNKDMQELIRQISIFAEHRTDSGTINYHAPGEEHDDLVMALLIACFVARKWIRITDNTGGTIMGTIDAPAASHNSLSRYLYASPLMVNHHDEFGLNNPTW